MEIILHAMVQCMVRESYTMPLEVELTGEASWQSGGRIYHLGEEEC